MVDLYIRFIFGIISMLAIVVVNFAIFKIQIKGNDKQIAIIALVVGIANVYFKFVIGSTSFFIVQIITYIILLTLLRRYPLFYSMVVCVVGSFVAAMIDTTVTLTALGLKFVTIDGTLNSPKDFIILNLVFATISFIISWLLIRYKIGFTFVVRRFTGKYSLRSSTFVWAVLLILGVLILQFSSRRYPLFSLNSFTVLITALAFIVIIIYAYYQNKKSLLSRFGEGKKGG
jgi:hypothetical protein